MGEQYQPQPQENQIRQGREEEGEGQQQQPPKQPEQQSQQSQQPQQHQQTDKPPQYIHGNFPAMQATISNNSPSTSMVQDLSMDVHNTGSIAPLSSSPLEESNCSSNVSNVLVEKGPIRFQQDLKLQNTIADVNITDENISSNLSFISSNSAASTVVGTPLHGSPCNSDVKLQFNGQQKSPQLLQQKQLESSPDMLNRGAKDNGEASSSNRSMPLGDVSFAKLSPEDPWAEYLG